MTGVLKTIKARPLVAFIIACALVLAPVSAGMAKATEGLNPDAKCELKLRLPQSVADIISDKRVDVDIYKVASVTGEESYELEPSFAGAWETSPDIFSDSSVESMPSNSPSQDLVNKILDICEKSNPKPEPTKSVKVGKDGASINDLACGLYLVKPKKLNLTDCSLSPVATLISLPTKAIATETSFYYSYLVTATLKMEIAELTNDLVIEKSLKTMNATLGNPAFVFHVEATKDGKTVYDDMVSMTFTEAGKKQTIVKDIPVGSNVKVTEVYSGSSYEIVGKSSDTVTIAADEITKVSFTNDYDDDNKYGTGVNNMFSYSESADGYEVAQDPALNEQAQG